jgi:hypothetical protein
MNMRLIKNTLCILAATSVLAFADTGTSSVDSDICDAFCGLADVVFVRPIALAGTIGGFGLFAASSPFTAMGGVVEDSWDILVQKPGEFAITRDLGDFDCSK